ncbi:MAG: HepT-like ribonuclease domain-containing protein [Thermomicrobiales bacterium]
MNSEDSRIPGYLRDIVERTDRILQFTKDVTFAEFLDNLQLQDAVIHNFEIIGEASGSLLREHREFAERNPELPLRPANGLRNRLAHGYRDVNLETVWNAIERDLSRLREQVLAILEKTGLE